MIILIKNFSIIIIENLKCLLNDLHTTIEVLSWSLYMEDRNLYTVRNNHMLFQLACAHTCSFTLVNGP